MRQPSVYKSSIGYRLTLESRAAQKQAVEQVKGTK